MVMNYSLCLVIEYLLLAESSIIWYCSAGPIFQTDFSGCGFHHLAPAAGNLLPVTVLKTLTHFF